MLHSRLLRTLTDASVVVKSSIGLLVVFYFIGLIPPVYSVLSLSPALLLPPNFRVWTLITGLLIEATFFNLVIDIPVMIVCGMYLEPVWGAMELLKFIAITGVGTAISTSFVSLAAYAITHNHSFWFVQFSGVAGVLGGVTVAFKQILPDQKLNLKYKVLRVQQLPFITIVLFILLSLIGVFQYTQIVMVVCGIAVGWTYLRFYQPHGRNSRGDMNEMFEAATLFPPIVRPLVGLVSTVLFKFAVSVGLCKLPVRTYDVGAPSSITISLPGTDPADAERRRKKALRALNERLERQKSPDDDQLEDEDDEKWPTMEDDGFTSSSSSILPPPRSEDDEGALLTSTPTDTSVDITDDAPQA
jgi:membrane associated rhomboid family serine protease